MLVENVGRPRSVVRADDPSMKLHRAERSINCVRQT